MSGKETDATKAALVLVTGGMSASGAAREAGVDLRTVTRAMLRHGIKSQVPMGRPPKSKALLRYR